MSKRKNKLQGDIGAFLKQYQRKAYPTHDPNDRHYSRDIERKIKSMDAEELGELMSGEGADISREEETSWFNGNNPPGVHFSLNDAVAVENGGVGSVVSLLQVRPVPKFLIEIGNGDDIEVFQSEMSKIT